MKIPIDQLAVLIEEFASDKGAYFSPTGTSMLPTLKNGDKVFLIKRTIKKNDIVFYKKVEGSYAMHRAIKLSDTSFIARGDNQFWIEEIPNENIIAVVDHYFHNKRKIDCNGFLFNVWTFILPIIRFLRRVFRKLKLINN